MRQIVSGRGSTFLLCQLSQSDKRFRKYPPQPITRCDGYEEKQAVDGKFTIEVLPTVFAVCRLNAADPVPTWAVGEFLSVTRTSDELSIVCPQSMVPAEIRMETGFRCLRVVGPFDFATIGVISALSSTLASARVSLFAVSTFDTDYLLVKESDLPGAISALQAAGHSMVKP